MKASYQRMSARFSHTSDAGLLITRLILGWLMIMHALLKFQGKGGLKSFEAFLVSLHNIPFPTLTGAVLPWAELILGILLVLGFLTRLAALALAAEMLVIALLVKIYDTHVGVIAAKGSPIPGAELDLVFMAGFIILCMLGPGRASADAALRLERPGGAAQAPELSEAQPARLSR